MFFGSRIATQSFTENCSFEINSKSLVVRLPDGNVKCSQRASNGLVISERPLRASGNFVNVSQGCCTEI